MSESTKTSGGANRFEKELPALGPLVAILSRADEIRAKDGRKPLGWSSVWDMIVGAEGLGIVFSLSAREEADKLGWLARELDGTGPLPQLDSARSDEWGPLAAGYLGDGPDGEARTRALDELIEGHFELEAVKLAVQGLAEAFRAGSIRQGSSA